MFWRPFLTSVHLIVPVFFAISALAAAQQAKPKDKAAAASKEPSPKVDAWLMRCDNAGKEFECSLSQTIVLQKTGQRLLSVVVRKPPKGEGAALMLHLPYGLHFPSGVTVQVDAGKVEMLQVQTCDEKGCYAGAPLAADRLGAMQSGEKLIVGFKDLKQQSINVPVPLAGFSEAFKKAP